MNKFSKNFCKGDTVKIDSPSGSWGIIVSVHANTGLYDVRWYYGKDVRGEYMTAVSRSLKSYELVPVDEGEFWKRANRNGFDGELGSPTPEPLFQENEILSWYEGEPKISGPYLIKTGGGFPVYAYWDFTNKEYTAQDGGLLTFASSDIIYFTQYPKGP